MSGLRVLHVVATTERRGAEVFAADLVGALRGSVSAQHVAIVRECDGDRVSYAAPTRVLGDGRDRSAGYAIKLKRVQRLRRMIKGFVPHVIQAHGGEALKACVLARACVPVVYRRIGVAPRALSHGWRRLEYQHLVARAARVVAVADSVRRESIALLNIPPARIVTIPNAVDMQRLDARPEPSVIRQELKISDTDRLLVSAGALSWEKDPLAHVRIGATILERMPDALHVFLGDGSMRPDVERQVRSLGLADRVRVLGSRDDVPGFLALADALLFASRPDGMEGMPAAIIEAGLLSTPSVAYDVAGVREVVVDGVTGRLVPWGEERALTRALLDLMDDHTARRRLGDAARQRYASEFVIDRVAPKYLEIYESLTTGR
jgi:glycosyltransferase involved in cell wall biosynthesis